MKTSTYELSLSWETLLVFMAAVLVITMPDFAYAAAPDGWGIGDVLCNGGAVFQGNAGKGLGTIVICTLGVGALLGKVSWGLAIMVGTGIGVVFGAGALFKQMYNGSGCGNVN